jgi:hypothetical protein
MSSDNEQRFLCIGGPNSGRSGPIDQSGYLPKYWNGYTLTELPPKIVTDLKSLGVTSEYRIYKYTGRKIHNGKTDNIF